MKRRGLILVAVLCVIYMCGCSNKEKVVEDIPEVDDGILYEEDGKTYGYGEGVDVYTPDIKEDMEVIHPTGEQDWSSGKFYVAGVQMDKDSDILSKLRSNGFTVTDSDGFITAIKDDVNLMLKMKDDTVSYIIDTAGTAGIVDGVTSESSKDNIKELLGIPNIETVYSKEMTGISYKDESNSYMVTFDFGIDDKLMQVTYEYLIQSEEVEVIPPEEVPAVETNVAD